MLGTYSRRGKNVDVMYSHNIASCVNFYVLFNVTKRPITGKQDPLHDLINEIVRLITSHNVRFN